MGSCSSLCSNKSEHIDYQQLIDRNEQLNNFKILIVGTKSSGKTSIMKQLDYIHGNNGQNLSKLCKNFVMDIRNDCIENITILCEMNEDEKYIEMLNEFDIENDSDLDNIANVMSNIWNQQDIKSLYSQRFHHVNYGYLLDDNMDYFFDKIEEIMNINYISNKQDIIKCKTSKCSVTDLSFNFHSFHRSFDFTDIGDYDCKSQIYNHLIFELGAEKDTKIIFTASLSDYCIYDTDDANSEKTRMEISLQYFEKIMSSHYVYITEIILLFTKTDIFRDCLSKGISLSHCFKDKWNGPEYVNMKLLFLVPYIVMMDFDKYIGNDIIELIQSYIRMEMSQKTKNMNDEQYLDFCYAEAIQFVAQQYHSKNMDKHSREIYMHHVNTMDADNVERVFNDVAHICIHSSLERGPL